jgi:hypothetical protein
VTRVALDHHGSGLKHGIGDLGNGVLLVVGLLGGDDGSEGRQHEVDTGERHEVGLELGEIDVGRTIETEGGGVRRDNMGDETVQVGIGGAHVFERAAATIVQRLIAEHDSDIRVLEQGAARQHHVVRLSDGVGNVGTGKNAETNHGLLAVVDRQALAQKKADPGSSATTNSLVW